MCCSSSLSSGCFFLTFLVCHDTSGHVKLAGLLVTQFSRNNSRPVAPELTKFEWYVGVKEQHQTSPQTPMCDVVPPIRTQNKKGIVFLVKNFSSVIPETLKHWVS